MHRSRVAGIVNNRAVGWTSPVFASRTPDADWYRHVYRELNTEADALANKAMDQQCSSEWARPRSLLRPYHLRGWFDGGKRNDELSSCGWLLQANFDECVDECRWSTVETASLLLPPGTTVIDCELTGAELVTAAAC